MFNASCHHALHGVPYEVWAADFSAMKFRKVSSHNVCAECIKHKAVIQPLSRHLLARRSQQEMYYKHLEDQFRDRCSYWKMRSDSRSRPDCLTVIVDGMDQAKTALPRHPSLKAKIFDGLQRPRLHLSAAISHGHAVNLFLTESDIPKDSNYSIESVCCALQQASRTMNLSEVDVVIQCDNTVRELKNGHVLRLCAALVSNQTVRTMAVSCLRAGHSHEDVDQLFGQIAVKIAKMKSVLTSENFLSALQRVCVELERPHERERNVFKIDQVRDWRPWLLSAIPARLLGIGGPGAPHMFLFSRYHMTGLASDQIQDSLYKKYRWHPHDVVLRIQFQICACPWDFLALEFVSKSYSLC